MSEDNDDYADLDEGEEDPSNNAYGLDIRPDSPGWDDVEADDDVEHLNVQCLLCDSTLSNATLMLTHCHEAHNFNFLAVRKQHDLDFYSTIKLVNYIRQSVKNGANGLPDTSSPEQWTDDQFLQPVLDDDALLFSLDDLIDFDRATVTVS